MLLMPHVDAFAHGVASMPPVSLSRFAGALGAAWGYGLSIDESSDEEVGEVDGLQTGPTNVSSDEDAPMSYIK